MGEIKQHMKYARINYFTKEKVDEDWESFFNYVMDDTKKDIEEKAFEESKDLPQADKLKYEFDIRYITAEEYNSERKHEIELKIKNAYRRFLGDDKTLTVREYNERMRNIDEYNKALDFYLQHESLKRNIRSIVDSSKLSLKEFDDYVEKLFKAIGSDEYIKLVEELQNK
jgi:hypothetical protein